MIGTLHHNSKVLSITALHAYAVDFSSSAALNTILRIGSASTMPSVSEPRDIVIIGRFGNPPLYTCIVSTK